MGGIDFVEQMSLKEDLDLKSRNSSQHVSLCRANDYNRYDCRIGRTGVRSSESDGHFSFIILIK